MIATRLQQQQAVASLGRRKIASSQIRRRIPSSAVKAPTTTTRPFSGSSSSSSFFGRAWERYTEALLARPLLVKGSAAAVIFFSSDVATQALTEDRFDLDIVRAASGSAFGVAATCWLHYWWGFLEIFFNRYVPAGAYNQNKLVNALGKVAADQLIGAPLYLYGYYCVTYFGKEWVDRKSNSSSNGATQTPEAAAAAAAENDTHEEETADDDPAMASALAKETSDRALEMLPDTLLRHWTLWPIVHTLNFYYNPIHHRVLVQNVVLIFWSGYLSHLNNGGLAAKEDSATASTENIDDSSKIGVIKTITREEVVEQPVVASRRGSGTPLATSARWA